MLTGYARRVFFSLEQEDLVEPRWCTLMERVSSQRTKKTKWRSTPEIDAGEFSETHARVLAWWIEAVGRELDCPVASER